MMDRFYHEVSLAFPDQVISHISVWQQNDTYRVLRIRLQGAHSESFFRSFLHERSPLEALVESSVHDAQDLGLMLPYEQINDVLLAGCKDIKSTSTDPVLVLKGVPVAKTFGLRASRPSVEGCLLRGDAMLTSLITKSRTTSCLEAFNEPTKMLGRRKTLYVGAIALFAIISGHQNAGSHTDDMLARRLLMLALNRLQKH